MGMEGGASFLDARYIGGATACFKDAYFKQDGTWWRAPSLFVVIGHEALLHPSHQEIRCTGSFRLQLALPAAPKALWQLSTYLPTGGEAESRDRSFQTEQCREHACQTPWFPRQR